MEVLFGGTAICCQSHCIGIPEARGVAQIVPNDSGIILVLGKEGKGLVLCESPSHAFVSAIITRFCSLIMVLYLPGHRAGCLDPHPSWLARCTGPNVRTGKLKFLALRCTEHTKGDSVLMA
jgi:hypothetical protein